MTKKDESPEEATNPYWSDELLAVLAEALGDEDRARQTLEGIIQQAQEGKAMQTLSTERLASHLTELYGRIAEGVQNSGVKKRRSQLYALPNATSASVPQEQRKASF